LSPIWPDTFKRLDGQSQQIRGAALVILEQILRKSAAGSWTSSQLLSGAVFRQYQPGAGEGRALV